MLCIFSFAKNVKIIHIINKGRRNMEKRFNFSGKVKVSKSNNPRGLYIHQQEAIKKLSIGSKQNKFCSLLVIPTGGGKTFTAVYWVLSEMINKNKKVLWLAHRHELLNQTLNTVVQTAYCDVIPNREDFSYRIISGSQEHDIPVNIKIDDDFIIASKDSLNYNKEYLKPWLEHNKNNICLIIDEAHHATAVSYRNIINMVNLACDKQVTIIGLTATPMRTNSHEKGYLEKIFSDGICYSVDLKTLINNGILAKPIIRDLKTDFQLKRELTSNELTALNRFQNLPEGVAKEIALNKNRNNFIVSHYLDNKDQYGKTLIFAINIDHAITLNSIFSSKGIKSDYVVSSIKDTYTGVMISGQDNEKKINLFRAGELEVLINVNILTEGTDIPTVKTVFLARPTTSAILLNQMIGRGLRGEIAGGTKEAYIVSFIDDWKYRINWVSPKELLKDDIEFIEVKHSNRLMEKTLIPIKMIEEFAKLMDSSVEAKFCTDEYINLVPLGSYWFNIFDEKEGLEESCEVLVFSHLAEPYKQFLQDLEYIFQVQGIGDRDLTEDSINELYDYVISNYFQGYDLEFGFNEKDIKDIIYYYYLTNAVPEFIAFDNREKYDVSILAKEIVNSNFNRREENEFLDSKWDNKELGWKIYFNNNRSLFEREVDREVRKLFKKENSEEPNVLIDKVDYTQLTLNQIREIDIKYWRYLSDAVYNKYKDKQGYYYSPISNYRNKSKRYFQIDHIVPISKGGKTEIDNLQILTRWENQIKKDKQLTCIQDEYKVEAVKSYFDNEEYDKAIDIIDEILKIDPNHIKAQRYKGKIALIYGEVNKARRIANQILKKYPDNIDGLYLLSGCYETERQYKKAIKIAEKILTIDVNQIEAYNILGDCYNDLRKYNIALNYYHKAIDLDDTHYYALFQVAFIYSRNRRYSESNEYYLKAVDNVVDKNDIANCLNNIGYNFEKMKNYQESLKYYKEGLKIDPDNQLLLQNKQNILKLISVEGF